MPSKLDLEMAAAMAELTAPDGPFAYDMIDRDGVPLRVLKNAPASLPMLFDRYCAQHGEAEFLVEGDLRLRFSQVHALATRLARVLVARHGVCPGSRVGLAARNSASWVICFMAIAMAGGCAVLLNGWWTAEELGDALALADCHLVLADGERALRLGGVADAPRVLTFGEGDPETGLAALLAGEAPVDLPDCAGEDLATIIFTSGSTGTCKGALSDHRALVQATMNFLAQTMVAMRLMQSLGESLPERQVGLLAIPLFHVTGLVPLLLQSLPLGRRLVIMRKWDAEEAMRLIEAERVTYFIGVPLMTHEMATHPRRAAYDLSSCGFFAAGGSARPPAHVGIMRQAMQHARPVLGYGLTETNAVGCTTLGDNYFNKPESTGPASLPLAEVAILDDAGKPLPDGEAGEVAIRSICTMRGYWRDPEATAAAFTADGWLRTGDIGRLDTDGYLTIVDRKKDLVIRGGENISCVEVERVLYAHPAVAEAAVFGIPDERLGEVPAAAWVARPDAEVSEEELRGFLKSHLAAFKIPVRLWRLNTPLPRLGSQKIDKPALRRQFAG